MKKDMQVATFIIFISVLVLGVVGPDVQHDQGVLELRQKPLPCTWLVFFATIFLFSSAIMMFTDQKKTKPLYAETCLIAVATSSRVLCPTIAKAFGSIQRGPLRTGLTIVYTIIMIVWTFQAIVEAKVVLIRTKYIPTYLSVSLLLNPLTGIIVWEDWRSITSWLGYICVCFQLLLGIYLTSELKYFEVHVVETQTRRGLMKQMLFVNHDTFRNRRKWDLPLYSITWNHHLEPFHQELCHPEAPEV